MKQVDMLRDLVNRFGDHEEVLIREYAAAERRGEVQRASNKYDLSPEAYARALISDARRKGWIRGFK